MNTCNNELLLSYYTIHSFNRAFISNKPNYHAGVGLNYYVQV